MNHFKSLLYQKVIKDMCRSIQFPWVDVSIDLELIVIEDVVSMIESEVRDDCR